MVQPQRNVIDPMFSTRMDRQRVATYTRRPVSYQPAVRHNAHKSSTVPPWLQTVTAQGTQQATTPIPAETASGAAGPVGKSPSVLQRLSARWPGKQAALLYVMAVILFLIGTAVSLNGLKANRQVAAQVKHVQQQADQSTATSPAAPSTQKPSETTVKNYAVAPNLPRYIDIPKLKIHSRTLSEGVDRKGELQVPWNIYDTGWYNASGQPGQNGAMLIDGHSGIGKTKGVFSNLSSLSAGDPIVVTRGDGQKFTYKVAKVQVVHVNDVDMTSMLVSINTNRPGLNLITCAGDIIPGTTELNERVIVSAVM